MIVKEFKEQKEKLKNANKVATFRQIQQAENVYAKPEGGKSKSSTKQINQQPKILSTNLKPPVINHVPPKKPAQKDVAELPEVDEEKKETVQEGLNTSSHEPQEFPETEEEKQQLPFFKKMWQKFLGM